MIYNKEDYTSDSCLTCLTRSTDTLLMLPFCNESFSVKVVRGAGVGTTECGVFPELSAQLSLCLSESSEHSVEEVQSLALFLEASTLWLLLLWVKPWC